MKRIAKHFNPATAMALVAMVFAMGGGAYAATGGGGSNAGHEGPRVNAKNKKGKSTTKGKRGPRGPQGKEGPAGPAGPTGEKGANGVNGTNGKDGAPGTNGVNGESVTITAEGECTKFSNASGEGKACAGKAGEAGKSVEVIPGEPASCKGAGGVTYEVEESGSPTAVCDGAPGAIHPGETLPAGATETGAWGFTVGSTKDGETTVLSQVLTPISFTIPLAANVTAENIHFVPLTGEGECKGTLTAPTAPEGQLCIYKAILTGATFSSVTQLTGFGTSTNSAGALIKFTELSDGAHGYGSWAVTGG